MLNINAVLRNTQCVSSNKIAYSAIDNVAEFAIIRFMNGKKERPWISDLIKKQQISQAEAARRINMPNDYLNKIIKGTRPFYPEEIFALSKILGVSMELLENGKEEKKYDHEDPIDAKISEIQDAVSDIQNEMAMMRESLAANGITLLNV